MQDDPVHSGKGYEAVGTCDAVACRRAQVQASPALRAAAARPEFECDEPAAQYETSVCPGPQVLKRDPAGQRGAHACRQAQGCDARNRCESNDCRSGFISSAPCGESLDADPTRAGRSDADHVDTDGGERLAARQVVHTERTC